MAMLAKKAPNPTDKHVGSRVRMRRMMLGMSQEKLGDALGLTFQQVQKYERGANRISASKLYEIARALRVPIAWFFEGLSDPEAGPADGPGRWAGDAGAGRGAADAEAAGTAMAVTASAAAKAGARRLSAFNEVPLPWG